MEKIIKILPILLVVACGSPAVNKNVVELAAKRDSLQNARTQIDLEINKVNQQIAEKDTTVNPNDIKIIKQITMQKNKLVKIEKKIKQLENKMTAKEQKVLVPVAVKNIKPERFEHHMVVYGNVEAKNYGIISPEMNGRIKKIYVREGQKVKEGTLLLSLNTDAINNQIKGVKATLDLAKSTYEKQKTLWDQGIGSEIQYLNAKTNKESLEAQLETLESQLRMSQIRAPFNGIVDKIYPKEGEIAGPAIPVIEFVSLGKLLIKADISEAYIDKVKVGQPVHLTFSSLPGYDKAYPIQRVSKVIDSKSRTFQIEIFVDNNDERIKPNMVSTIQLNDFASDQAFVVPSLAIRQDISGSYVYVVHKKDNKDVVDKKKIKTGLSSEEKTMVLSGLKEGDKVVVKGFHLVSAGVPVNVVD